MRIALISTPSTGRTHRWAYEQLAERGHVLDDHVAPDGEAAAAVTAGHDLADRWSAVGAPDVVLAIGWEAGLAAKVAARDHDTPVALRLTRAGRAPGSDRDRLELALARSSTVVLVPSAGEIDRLVDRGVPRHRLRVLPAAVDRSRFTDAPDVAELGAADDEPLRRIAVAAGSSSSSELMDQLAAMPDCEPIALDADAPDEELARRLRSASALVAVDDTDDEVTLVLRAMSCGVPTVAVDRGILTDLVADGVTGLLVSPAVLTEALRSLLADPMRRASLGLAAVDRVRARFTTTAAGGSLERALHDLVPAAEEALA